MVEPLDGVDVANGMVGYITLGVDLTATSSESSVLGGGGGAAPSGAVPSGAASSGAAPSSTAA